MTGGTASVELHLSLIEKLKHRDDLVILEQHAADDRGICGCLIQSNELKPGYHGVMDLIYEGRHKLLRFKKWSDT